MDQADDGVGKNEKQSKPEVHWEDNDNPIDRKLQQCLDTHVSTGAQSACSDDAYQAWDTELNTVYKDLMSKLPKEQKHMLLEEQRQWLKFRDQELKFIDQIYGAKHGSMYAPMEAYAKQELVKQRALQMHHRLEIVLD